MSWENVKPILRPEGVHMGIMKVDKDTCTSCGLCIQNCPFRAWEMGEDEFPRLKSEYECFSCYNCMVVCPVEAISIVEQYHVDSGFWATNPHPLPAKMPIPPKDENGNSTQWNAVEKAILERRSVRNFKDKPVPESFIRRVLEAGRFAPSAGNCQPWKFVVLTDKKLMKEIDEAVWGVINGVYTTIKNDDTVQHMAAMVDPASPGMFDPRLAKGGMGAIARKYGSVMLDAPAAILIAGDTRSIGSPQINVGICGQNMNLVANSLGIKACWVGFVGVLHMVPGFVEEKLSIKPPWQLVSSLVLGWPKFKQEGIVPREYRPVTWYRDEGKGPEVDEG
jgi:nitroreductase/NAD-dependent dihydropyrimidine dehydrogenase PreA subunit